ncbi:GANGLIOSIDE INDUCED DIFFERENTIATION ASSOCIATED PROTEIN 2-RELATED [Salix viminalis]|uniref:GANGLIOSIDE INDUCED DIFFERENTIATION ASSOCIATED PROTEIN 2-RELATED n=1 Tax=Salix viminalis TaxID=40686 RepID=A0A9Q0UW95_SALVM|nr:GANGLIOSIDE INDUCED DIFFERENTIATION ASSOCIATED PROTEIN 2-RELATED [Salix viminalis]
MCHHISLSDQEQLVEKLEIFKFQGRDKNGHKVLRIIGKFLSARFLSVDALKNYLEENIFPRLKKKPFSVLYLHTQVQKNENFPGISTLRSIYDVIPIDARDNLQAIYFLHPSPTSQAFPCHVWPSSLRQQLFACVSKPTRAILWQVVWEAKIWRVIRFWTVGWRVIILESVVLPSWILL